MAEAGPRPPRRRPSHPGRSIPAVEAGVCYQCGAPASHECRQGRRPVCDAHLVALAGELQSAFGPDACAECARYTAADLARGGSHHDPGLTTGDEKTGPISKIGPVSGRAFLR